MTDGGIQSPRRRKRAAGLSRPIQVEVRDRQISQGGNDRPDRSAPEKRLGRVLRSEKTGGIAWAVFLLIAGTALSFFVTHSQMLYVIAAGMRVRDVSGFEVAVSALEFLEKVCPRSGVHYSI